MVKTVLALPFQLCDLGQVINFLGLSFHLYKMELKAKEGTCLRGLLVVGINLAKHLALVSL